jgi:hypothetical protein
MWRFLLVFLWFSAFAANSAASEGTDSSETKSGTNEDRVSLDVEIDPLAYVFKGYSVHAGVRWWRLRFDLGAFAITVPEAFSTNEALEERYDGFGIKVDYRFATGRWIPFAGVSLSRALLHVRPHDSETTATTWQTVPAIRAGLEIEIAAGFYAAPWMSLGYAISDRSITRVGAETYESKTWGVFPTVHLGWHPP